MIDRSIVQLSTNVSQLQSKLCQLCVMYVEYNYLTILLSISCYLFKTLALLWGTNIFGQLSERQQLKKISRFSSHTSVQHFGVEFGAGIRDRYVYDWGLQARYTNPRVIKYMQFGGRVYISILQKGRKRSIDKRNYQDRVEKQYTGSNYRGFASGDFRKLSAAWIQLASPHPSGYRQSKTPWHKCPDWHSASNRRVQFSLACPCLLRLSIFSLGLMRNLKDPTLQGTK